MGGQWVLKYNALTKHQQKYKSKQKFVFVFFHLFISCCIIIETHLCCNILYSHMVVCIKLKVTGSIISEGLKQGMGQKYYKNLLTMSKTRHGSKVL